MDQQENQNGVAAATPVAMAERELVKRMAKKLGLEALDTPYYNTLYPRGNIRLNPNYDGTAVMLELSPEAEYRLQVQMQLDYINSPDQSLRNPTLEAAVKYAFEKHLPGVAPIKGAFETKDGSILTGYKLNCSMQELSQHLGAMGHEIAA